MPVTREGLLQALKLGRETGGERKFVQSVELVINLKDIDPKKPEERITVEALLPHGLGRPRRIGFFAEGELARLAREGGADPVLSGKDINELGDDRKGAKRFADECDLFLAQTDLMPLIGRRLGPVLGPKSKMPKPVAPGANPVPLIERSKRVVSLRTKDQPTLQAPIGTERMPDEQLAENALAVLEVVERGLPKGFAQVKSVSIKLTMGKPVKVEV